MANTTTVGTQGQLHPNHRKLIDTCCAFLAEVENLTPGKDIEDHLNTTYGSNSHYYREFTTQISTALTDGSDWFANMEIAGPYYRRSSVSPPTEASKYCSITAVYFDTDAAPSGSLTEGKDRDEEKDRNKGSAGKRFRGQYHKHPYGEINCVIPLTPGAELMGPSGWQGAGWTSPGPGSHHYPEARGGKVVALFFLPAGRIAYITPPGEEDAKE